MELTVFGQRYAEVQNARTSLQGTHLESFDPCWAGRASQAAEYGPEGAPLLAPTYVYLKEQGRERTDTRALC